MRKKNYVLSCFNVLDVSSDRAEVVELVQVNVSQIVRLVQELGVFLDFPLRWASSGNEIDVGSTKASQLSDACDEVWEVQKVLGFSMRRYNRKLLERCTATGRILDLAIVAYCGLHLARFDEIYLGKFCGRTHGYLHDQQAWVFERAGLDDVTQSNRNPLWLSTTVEKFASVWGPMWNFVDSERSGTVTRYNIEVEMLCLGQSPIPILQRHRMKISATGPKVKTREQQVSKSRTLAVIQNTVCLEMALLG
ncbi:MAG: hypothetical protein M1827_001565 [Pycnora praestabilis]|nr:MAG: hypothetical protein M1827_001565 [Pycnora praestabilis]